MPSTPARTDRHGDPSADDLTADLRVELWAARDAVIGAEATAGQLRARVKELESELDSHQRHVDALVAEVTSMREHVAGLEAAAAHRDAILRSPTWRAGTIVMRPLQAVRRRPPPTA